MTTSHRRERHGRRDDRDVVARLERLGARLVDEIVNYEDVYLLYHVRSREGFIVELAQELGGPQ